MTGRGGSLIVPIPATVQRSQFDPIDGLSPLVHCLRAMLDPSHRFERVVVPTAGVHVADARSVLPDGVVVLEVGKEGTRTDCLEAALDDSDYVVVHDVSRPLAPTSVRDRVIHALVAGSEFVVPTLVVVDSVKAVDDAGSVVATVDRSALRSTQFPRGMATSVLHQIVESGSDELAYALRTGMTITTVDGDPNGFEVLAPRDTALAEAIIGADRPATVPPTSRRAHM